MSGRTCVWAPTIWPRPVSNMKVSRSSNHRFLPLARLTTRLTANERLRCSDKTRSFCFKIVCRFRSARAGSISGFAPRIVRVASLTALALGFLSVAWFAIGAAVAKPTLPADETAAGRWIRAHVAPGLVVQGSPLRDNSDLVYLTGHPAVLSDSWAGRLFYSKPEDYSLRMASLRQAFSTPDSTVTCPILQSLGLAALVVGPPEERDFPLLARPQPWPCLSEAYHRGTYRVYRLL